MGSTGQPSPSQGAPPDCQAGLCHRAVRASEAEYDDEGDLEGWMLTLECGHRYWYGAETSDGVPKEVWCHFCETRAVQQ
jgi:hypothetical protein